MLQFEQRANFKSCKELDKSASETFQMIKQAYGEEALGRSAVFKWHKCFAQGKDSLKDDEHAGRQRTVGTELKIQEVAMLVRANSSQTVNEAAAAGISYGTCHKILFDILNKSRVTQHSVPCALTQDRSNDRMSTCADLIAAADKDGTANETYDPQLKRQSAT
jgi:hypothetical protein